MWKNIVQPGRPQMTIWRMCISCWILTATNTRSNISFLLRQSLHKRVSMLRYTYIASLLRMNVSVTVFRDVALCRLIESTNIWRNLLPPSSEEKKQRYTYRQKRTETLSPVVRYHFLLFVRFPFFRAAFSFILKM